MDDFNLHVYENVFSIYFDKIQLINEEKYQRYFEVSNNYNLQIKEMEFLLSGIINFSYIIYR